jgi:uridine kinase
MRRILDEVSESLVAVLDHDAYYRDFPGLTLEERTRQNFDHPRALETELLCAHLDALKEGKAIQKPVYDFGTHSRRPETVLVEPRPVVIVEGILVLADPDLVSRLDLCVFVRADDDIRLVRRIRRDVEERGRSVESVLTQYENTVRPMYLAFVEPSIRNAHVIIPRGGHNHMAIEVLVGFLRSLRMQIHEQADTPEHQEAINPVNG